MMKPKWMQFRGRPLLRIALLVIAAAPAAFAVHRTAMAQESEYPKKPVKILVAAAAGGSSDMVARLIAQGLQTRWKQPVVVENRPGANGLVASQALIASPADGYTLMLGSIGQMMLNPIQYGSKYEPNSAYTPIAQATTSYMVLVTAANAPYGSLSAFVDYARSHPTQASFSSSGNGSLMHIAGERLKMLSNTSMVHIPYKGESAAITDLMSGAVSAGFIVAGTGAELVRAGKLKGLAVSESRRASGLNTVPTAVEQGFDIVMPVWNGLIGPAGLDKVLVEKINTDVNAVLGTVAVQQSLAGMGMTAAARSSRDFAAYIASEELRWRSFVADSKISLQ